MAKLQRLRELIWDRAGGYCEITGVPLGERGGDGYALHHRRPKGMGGSDLPSTDSLPNAIAITHEVHNGHRRSVHLDPAWSRPRGYLLGHAAVPALEPMWYRGQRWVLLTRDGGLLEVRMPPPA